MLVKIIKKNCTVHVQVFLCTLPKFTFCCSNLQVDCRIWVEFLQLTKIYHQLIDVLLTQCLVNWMMCNVLVVFVPSPMFLTFAIEYTHVKLQIVQTLYLLAHHVHIHLFLFWLAEQYTLRKHGTFFRAVQLYCEHCVKQSSTSPFHPSTPRIINIYTLYRCSVQLPLTSLVS